MRPLRSCLINEAQNAAKNRTQNAKTVAISCGPKRGQIGRQPMFTIISQVFPCFLLAAFWAACLASPFREGWKGCFPPDPAKDTNGNYGPQGQEILHASGQHDQYVSTRSNSNKEVADKQGGTRVEVAETNKQHCGTQQK